MKKNLPGIILDLFNKLLNEAIHTQESIEFSLPQLYEIFLQQDEQVTKSSYPEFRKALFSSPINEKMKTCGGEIVISKNTGKVDESVYCLKLVGVKLC